MFNSVDRLSKHSEKHLGRRSIPTMLGNGRVGSSNAIATTGLPIANAGASCLR